MRSHLFFEKHLADAFAVFIEIDLDFSMSAYGKRCLKYENAFTLAAADSLAASDDCIHFHSASYSACILLYLHFHNINKNKSIYIDSTMVILTVVAPSNNHTIYLRHPIPEPNYIRLISCSLYNSWYNLEKKSKYQQN